MGLALPHQLWTGREFLASTAATVYWWALWALAAGAVLVWRVGRPLWRNARHRLHVTAVVPEAAGVVSVYLSGRHLDRLPAQAGQFLTWRFLNRQGWTRAQPLLAVGRTRRAQPADHRQGAGRRQRPARARCARAPGSCSKGPTGG